MKVFDLCLEMSSDPKNYFGSAFDELTELTYIIKLLSFSECPTAGHGLK